MFWDCRSEAPYFHCLKAFKGVDLSILAESATVPCSRILCKDLKRCLTSRKGECVFCWQLSNGDNKHNGIFPT